MVETDGKLLLAWLRLLGWVVIIEETERDWVAFARHEQASGDILEVKASGRTHAEIVWNVFEAALNTLEGQRTRKAA